MDLLSDIYKYNPEYHKFADLLGVDKKRRDDIKVAQKLSLLYDWAKERVGADDLVQIADEVNALRKQEGLSLLGTELVGHLYEKVRIEMDKKREVVDAKERMEQKEKYYAKLEEESKRATDWVNSQEKAKQQVAAEGQKKQVQNSRYFSRVQNSVKTYDKTSRIPYDKSQLTQAVEV